MINLGEKQMNSCDGKIDGREWNQEGGWTAKTETAEETEQNEPSGAETTVERAGRETASFYLKKKKKHRGRTRRGTVRATSDSMAPAGRGEQTKHGCWSIFCSFKHNPRLTQTGRSAEGIDLLCLRSARLWHKLPLRFTDGAFLSSCFQSPEKESRDLKRWGLIRD